MNKFSACMLLIGILGGTALFGEDGVITPAERSAAEALLASPGQKSAGNDELEYMSLLKIFFQADRGRAATREYRLRCRLYYEGLRAKSRFLDRFWAEKEPEARGRIRDNFIREYIPAPCPDWKRSGAEEPSWEGLLDYFFHGGSNTSTWVSRLSWENSHLTLLSEAALADLLIAEPSGEKHAELLSCCEKWAALDVERNSRDEASQGNGAWRSLFIVVMQNDREKKFREYLKNFALMNEIANFPVRCSRGMQYMKNGELDHLFPEEEDEPEHYEPFAIIAPSTVRKKVIDGDVWHIAVFLPDYLIVHEVKRGGCLVVWKNGEHVASFTWRRKFDIRQIGMTATKKVKIVGEEYDYDTSLGIKSMVFDLTVPNGRELDVNYW